MGPLTQFIQEKAMKKMQLRNMIARLEALAKEASNNDVKLMIDAEQTYMQPGIDHLALNLQRKYNKKGKDVIYTHRNYNAQVQKLLENNQVSSFMVASHNEDSVKNTVAFMRKLNIDRRTGGVYIGQLLGMCDHASYTRIPCL
jgi:proline dehydrogenase